jgi:chromosome partitioning protein
VQQYRDRLIPIGPELGQVAWIPKRSAVAEAQAQGEVLWEMKKSAARDAWKEMEPSISRIAGLATSTARDS